jgi:hypothetical protein
MPEPLESPKQHDADEIAELADRGESISRFFTNSGRLMLPRTTWEEEDGKED